MTQNIPLSFRLEKQVFEYKDRWIDFRTYLEKGYELYRLWLKMILGYQYSKQINFCLARHMNQFRKHMMGIDL